MDNRKYCSFPVKATKAYVDDAGMKHVVAIASDTGLDWYLERFAEMAIDDMVMYSRQRKANKPEEGLVDLRETHWDTFGIGFADDGEKVVSEKTDLHSYRVDLALKPNVWQADELYNDVKRGVVDKQLSVGGYIPNWDTDYEVVRETFENDGGEEVEVSVGVIKRFMLEHIAVTPPEGAANPRTEFEFAKGKPDVYKNGYVYKSAMDKNYQKRFENDSQPTAEDKAQKDSFLKSAITELKSVVREVFGEVLLEREEQMTKVEKGKKLVEDLRSMIEDSPEDFTEEIVKSLGISFVTDSEEPEVEVMTEEKVQSVVKTRLDTLSEDFEAKIEEVRKSIPTIPEIPEDQSEKVKSLEEKITELETRLKAIENEAPAPQDEPGQTGDVEDEDVDSGEEDSGEELPEDIKMWS